jgi:hypothetical protein
MPSKAVATAHVVEMATIQAPRCPDLRRLRARVEHEKSTSDTIDPSEARARTFRRTEQSRYVLKNPNAHNEKCTAAKAVGPPVEARRTRRDIPSSIARVASTTHDILQGCRFVTVRTSHLAEPEKLPCFGCPLACHYPKRPRTLHDHAYAPRTATARRASQRCSAARARRRREPRRPWPAYQYLSPCTRGRLPPQALWHGAPGSPGAAEWPNWPLGGSLVLSFGPGVNRRPGGPGPRGRRLCAPRYAPGAGTRRRARRRCSAERRRGGRGPRK